MSNDIHCPKCGSDDVECVEKPSHHHRCHACGYDGTRPVDPPTSRWTVEDREYVASLADDVMLKVVRWPMRTKATDWAERVAAALNAGHPTQDDGSSTDPAVQWETACGVWRQRALDAEAALNADPNPADTEPTAERTYPHTGTCDSCAEGPKPLREVDPESQAWVCRECDAVQDAAIAAAVRTGIDAYNAALMREGDDSRG